MGELHTWSATRMAEGVRDGEVSATELVDACIARVEACDPAVNALVLRRFDGAREEARHADARRAAGEPIGPLHGVPITVKDQFHCAGLPTTLGLAKWKSRISSVDGPLVGRLRAAGAIVLGKGNVMQLLLGWECDNPAFGRTNNPWDLARTPGGSSGGDAAIVAYGGAPLALGGDFGGSLRVPAAFCGVATLKTTGGRLTPIDTPPDPYAPQEGVIPQPGPLARSVADVALALRVLAAPGQERLDPSVPPVPWVEPGDEPLRVGISDHNGLFAASPAIRRAVARAGQALAAAGARVEPVDPIDGERSLRMFVQLTAGDGFARAAAVSKGETLFGPLAANLQLAAMPSWLAAVVAMGMRLAGRGRIARVLTTPRPTRTGDYFEVLGERAAFRREVLAAWDRSGIDVLVCPAFGTPAFPHGASEHLLDAASYAVAANALGFPAGVVPVGFVEPADETGRAAAPDLADRTAADADRGSAGLPVGIQLIGRPWEEHRVLAAMAALEAALGGPERLSLASPAR